MHEIKVTFFGTKAEGTARLFADYCEDIHYEERNFLKFLLEEHNINVSDVNIGEDIIDIYIN